MQALTIEGREISRLFLIDDDPNVREGYDEILYDLNVSKREVEKIPSVVDLLAGSDWHDGYVCDFQLTNTKYSPVNGDVIVAQLYNKKIPAVLCSRNAEMAATVRNLRHAIPCILEARDLNGDAVVAAFSTCIKEFSNKFTKQRRPWPTLVRIESMVLQTAEFSRVAVVVPGWDAHLMIEIDLSHSVVEFYDEIVACLNKGDIYRLKASVNLDAEGLKDIYIKDWLSIK